MQEGEMMMGMTRFILFVACVLWGLSACSRVDLAALKPADFVGVWELSEESKTTLQRGPYVLAKNHQIWLKSDGECEVLNLPDVCTGGSKGFTNAQGSFLSCKGKWSRLNESTLFFLYDIPHPERANAICHSGMDFHIAQQGGVVVLELHDANPDVNTAFIFVRKKDAPESVVVPAQRPAPPPDQKPPPPAPTDP